MRAAAEALAPTVGLSAACRALGVPRSVGLPSTKPRCAFSASTQTAPFARPGVPREGAGVRYAPRGAVRRPGSGGGICHLAGGRPLPMLDPDDVSHAEGRRGSERTPTATTPSSSGATPTDGHLAQPGLDLGHHAYPVRGSGRPSPSTSCWIQEADPRRLSEARCRARSAYAPPGPWCPNDSQDLFAVSGGSRHPGQLQSASRIRRQPVLGKPFQDAETRAGLSRTLVSCRRDSFTKSFDLRENGIGRGGP